VAERLRFFLSDANLRQDVFLRKIMLDDQGEYPHKVTPETLLKFNTIKHHTMDPEVVLEAAKTLGDKLTVSDDGKAIGLVEPFTMEKMDDNIPLSLLVENLPVDEESKRYKVDPDEIRKLFDEYGRVALVKLRFHLAKRENGDRGHSSKKQHQKRVPSGSVLVEFETAEELEKASADVLTCRDGDTLEPKRKLEISGAALRVMPLKEWIDSRKKIKEQEEEGRKKDGQEKEEEKKKRKIEDEKALTFTFDWKPGCVIRIEGITTPDCDREAILDMITTGLGTTLAAVKETKVYVDYSRGQEKGAIRFPEPSDDIKTICDKLKSGDLKIKEDPVKEAKILEGEEEKKYWEDFIDFKSKQLQQKAGERGGHRHGHKRSRHN
jgi:lupus La protein